MSKSPKKLFTEVEVIDTSIDGLGICKAGERVYFIPNTVPGDIVDVEVWKARSKFFTGKAIKFHKYSDRRTDPVCKHFGDCGGCKWQNMQYT